MVTTYNASKELIFKQKCFDKVMYGIQLVTHLGEKKPTKM